jgi:hypothetical protein
LLMICSLRRVFQGVCFLFVFSGFQLISVFVFVLFLIAKNLPFKKNYFFVKVQSLHGLFGLIQNWFVMGQTVNLSFNQRFNASCTALVTSFSSDVIRFTVLDSNCIFTVFFLVSWNDIVRVYFSDCFGQDNRKKIVILHIWQ